MEFGDKGGTIVPLTSAYVADGQNEVLGNFR